MKIEQREEAQALALQRALALKKTLKQLSKNQLIEIVLRLEAEFIEQQMLNRELAERLGLDKKEEEVKENEESK